MTKPDQQHESAPSDPLATLLQESIARLKPLRDLDVTCCCHNADCPVLSKARESFAESVDDGLSDLGQAGLQMIEGHAAEVRKHTAEAESLRRQNEQMRDEFAEKMVEWERKEKESLNLEEQLYTVTAQLDSMAKRVEDVMGLEEHITMLEDELVKLQKKGEAEEQKSKKERAEHAQQLRTVEDLLRESEERYEKLKADYETEKTKSSKRIQSLEIQLRVQRLEPTLERSNSMPVASVNQTVRTEMKEKLLYQENKMLKSKVEELESMYHEAQEEIKTLQRKLAYAELNTNKSALTTGLMDNIDPLAHLGTTAPTVHVHNYYSIAPRKRKSTRRRPQLPQDQPSHPRIFTAASSYTSTTIATNPRWSAATTLAPLSPQHYKHPTYHAIEDHLNGTSSAPASPGTSPALQSPITMSRKSGLYRSNSHESVLSMRINQLAPSFPSMIRDSSHVVQPSHIQAEGGNVQYSSKYEAYGHLKRLGGVAEKTEPAEARKGWGYGVGGFGGLKKIPSWWSRRTGSSTENTPGPTPGTTPTIPGSLQSNMKRENSSASVTSFASSTTSSRLGMPIGIKPAGAVATTSVTSAPMNIPKSVERDVKTKKGVGRKLLGTFVDTEALRDSLREHEGMLG